MTKRKSKKRNSSSPSSGSASSGAKKIVLKDMIPSAISLRVECHKLLWAMIEVTSMSCRKSITVEEAELADNAELLKFCNYSGGVKGSREKDLMEVETSDCLPSTKKRKKSQFGINDNMSSRDFEVGRGRDARLSVISAIIMRETDSRDMWYDHIYMLRQEGKDGKSVPVRIEGCASGARNTVVASVLGNPKEKLFLPRDSNILYSLTSEERCSVLKLFHTAYGDLPGVDALQAPEGVHPKYWDQRYRLFRKFDMGIQLDPESWFSITPEVVGTYLAKKIRNRRAKLQSGGVSLTIGKIVDAFSGCGGCAIPLANLSIGNDANGANEEGKENRRGEVVVAIDTDEMKLQRLLHNATIYQAHHRIEVKCCDVREYLHSLPNLSVVSTERRVSQWTRGRAVRAATRTVISLVWVQWYSHLLGVVQSISISPPLTEKSSRMLWMWT